MENIVRKAEIACNKQFLLFSQCFLPYIPLIFHFKCTLKCRLQFVSIWTSLQITVSNEATCCLSTLVLMFFDTSSTLSCTALNSATLALHLSTKFLMAMVLFSKRLICAVSLLTRSWSSRAEDHYLTNYQTTKF